MSGCNVTIAHVLRVHVVCCWCVACTLSLVSRWDHAHGLDCGLLRFSPRACDFSRAAVFTSVLCLLHVRPFWACSFFLRLSSLSVSRCLFIASASVSRSRRHTFRTTFSFLGVACVGADFLLSLPSFCLFLPSVLLYFLLFKRGTCTAALPRSARRWDSARAALRRRTSKVAAARSPRIS